MGFRCPRFLAGEDGCDKGSAVDAAVPIESRDSEFENELLFVDVEGGNSMDSLTSSVCVAG
jgi:hypothetical protein